jgi:hypothetical protein
MQHLTRNIELNAQVTAVVDCTNNIEFAYRAAKALIEPLFAECNESDEIWTDAAEDKFCSSPWDRLASTPAEYAMIRASIVAECDEFEMAENIDTARQIKQLIDLARADDVPEELIENAMPFLTRNNFALQSLVAVL